MQISELQPFLGMLGKIEMWSVVSVVSKYDQHITFPIILNQIFNIYNILIYNINKKIMKYFQSKVWSKWD